MEERFPIYRMAANIFNKQSRTADKGWSFSLLIGRGDNNSNTRPFYERDTCASDLD